MGFEFDPLKLLEYADYYIRALYRTISIKPDVNFFKPTGRGRNRIFNQNLILFTLLNIAFGLGIQQITPKRPPLTQLFSATALIIVTWLLFSVVVYKIFDWLGGKKDIIWTSTICLQFLSATYLTSSLFAFIVSVIWPFLQNVFNLSSTINPTFSFFAFELIFLLVLLASSLNKIHFPNAEKNISSFFRMVIIIGLIASFTLLSFATFSQTNITISHDNKPAQTPIPTPTVTSTMTPTGTPTETRSQSSAINSLSLITTPTLTSTPTPTTTSTRTYTPTPTNTATLTIIPTITPTSSLTPTLVINTTCSERQGTFALSVNWGSSGLPGVTVQIKEEWTGDVHEAVTNEAGQAIICVPASTNYSANVTEWPTGMKQQGPVSFSSGANNSNVPIIEKETILVSFHGVYPDAFSITSPRDGDLFTKDNVLFSWAKAPFENAGFYEIIWDNASFDDRYSEVVSAELTSFTLDGTDHQHGYLEPNYCYNFFMYVYDNNMGLLGWANGKLEDRRFCVK